MKKYLLFTPGPVNVSRNLHTAICKPDICHRESDFDRLLESIENKLLRLFEIKNQSQYRAVVITGSGTAANESILSSVVGNQNILILSNGEFGERLFNISKIYNPNTYFLDFGWGKNYDLEKVEASLKTNKIDIVAMVHHETSSGMLNSLENIGAITNKNKLMLIVDCVSSAGAEVIDMEKNHIAFCSSSSSKAIGSQAGLSFVIGEIKEFEKLKSLPQKSVYLNLDNFYQFLKKYSQTPNTPAVHLFFALEQALKNIINQGIESRHAEIKRKADLLRRGMTQAGLKFVIDRLDMCSVLTTVYLPSHINVAVFREKLRQKSIIIYEGKGCFKGKAFQIGNIGELSIDDIQYFLDCLEKILSGIDAKPSRLKLPVKNLGTQLGQLISDPVMAAESL